MKIYVLQYGGAPESVAVFTSLHKVMRNLWEYEVEEGTFDAYKIAEMYRRIRTREADHWENLLDYDWKECPFDLYVREIDDPLIF